MEFFDSHSHYNDEQFDIDREKIIEDTYNDGITRFICAGYDLESSKFSIEIAKKYNFIYSICGISPNDVPDNKDKIDEQLQQLEQMIKQDICMKENSNNIDNKKMNVLFHDISICFFFIL